MSVQTGAAIIFDSAVQRRALLVCVGVSVVVHGLVLFALPGFQAGAPASRSRILTATLAADAALPGKEVSIEPPARPDRPRERPRRVLMPETAPRALEAPAAPAVPPPSAPASAYAAGASTSSAIDAPGRSAIPGAQAPAATAGSSGEASAADEASLERYRLGLIDAARRYRRYPVLAMEKGWQGRVEIRLVVPSRSPTAQQVGWPE